MSLPAWRPGPAMLVTAAFIGPGTVTACASAGLGFGAALLWALAFATLATIILQNMAARVAIVTGKGLAEAILGAASSLPFRWALGLLIFAALAIGNAAYQAGNISGTAIGLSLAGYGASGDAARESVLGIGLLAAALVIVGKPRWLEALLIGLVLAMAAAFTGALLVIDIDWRAAFAGLAPVVPAGGLLTAIALIGTTIVPYNLFLHAASVRGQFAADAAGIASARMDTVVSVTLGGLLSMAIVVIAAAAQGKTAGDASPLVQVAARLQD
ncbi:divalent metal cation transporter, partial [Blastomonas sp.]|uniref:divalent metal cation transporter n=1 Tax=Blastomonas sp. TaxID=1909299 RepID=UPI003593F4C7